MKNEFITITLSNGEKQSFAINLIPYIANYESGKIYLTEHAAYKFLDKKDLLNLDWADADLPIVNELLNLKL